MQRHFTLSATRLNSQYASGVLNFSLACPIGSATASGPPNVGDQRPGRRRSRKHTKRFVRSAASPLLGGTFVCRAIDRPRKGAGRGDKILVSRPYQSSPGAQAITVDGEVA